MSFVYKITKAQNNSTNRQLRMNKHLFFFDFGMSQMLPVKQSLHPFKKFCLRVLMIAINVSVAICQLPIRQFCSFGKRSIVFLLIEIVCLKYCF